MIGDKVKENDEKFTVFLFLASGAQIQDNDGRVTIVNDDTRRH